MSEKLITKILSLGAALTTILVVSGSVTDPVNTPKFVSVGVFGCAAIGALLSSRSGRLLEEYRPALVMISLFISSMLLAVVSSKSPLSQNMYGSYGRNNGFFMYLFLAMVFLSALALRSSVNFESIVRALLFAGLINVAYCLWVISFGDFVGWSNPYGNILGTLGNPNFIGSFLGIFFTAYLAYAVRESSSKLLRFSLVAVLPITAFEIYNSHAIQGRVVAALGVGILGLLLIRSRFRKWMVIAYVIAGIFAALLALLGALQIGPLTNYIYKTSVSLRGQYWLAGWNTGKAHPFTGVGMDSFGDWYRRSRDIHALELPGVNVTVNAAHNVPMDMFAFGGWPLLVVYLLIMSIAGIAAARLVIRNKTFDPILAVLLTSWVGYQVQSIISINQIGLAVWGWLLSGLLIAYERVNRVSFQESSQPLGQQNSKSKLAPASVHPRLIVASSVGAIVGLLIALPPLAADVKWRSSQVDRTLPSLEATMQPGYFNPQNSSKFLTNIQILESSNLPDLSHKYALEAVKWNPEDFNLWKILYLIQKSSSDEKNTALNNMKRLDPLNPDVTSSQ